MSRSDAPAPKGRGAGFNPANRFEATHHELELEQVEEDEEYLDALNRPPDGVPARPVAHHHRRERQPGRRLRDEHQPLSRL